ncbi:hypothetical protein BVRB_6g145120 [Beta vulgaris subsp. vulgaris]|uniref:Uncharacterized protein n=1 Tax=Beta vulgaris subsp. vulgaris TaxID=3555 RepID=A0A0J8C350_BETVV|nr:hypothetical protein BVRB_6g145120 [Beta vulgaris subsp. vulgaris]
MRHSYLVTSSSSDSSISIYDIMRRHRDGVTAISLSPNSTCLASGSIGRTVKLYKFPKLRRTTFLSYVHLADLELAEFDIKKALEIDPDNRDVKLEYKKLKEKIREYNKKDAQFYGKMFSKIA